MKDEIKGNVNIHFDGIFDYIRDKDLEISFLHNRINLKDKEIKRLNNIIDELEKCLDKNIALNYYKNGVRQYNKTLTEGAKMFRDYIKDKLKELKDRIKGE